MRYSISVWMATAVLASACGSSAASNGNSEDAAAADVATDDESGATDAATNDTMGADIAAVDSAVVDVAIADVPAADVTAADVATTDAPAQQDTAATDVSDTAGGIPSGNAWVYNGVTYSPPSYVPVTCALGATYYSVTAMGTVPTQSNLIIYLPKSPVAGSSTGIIDPNNVPEGKASVQFSLNYGKESWQSDGGTIEIKSTNGKWEVQFAGLPIKKTGGTDTATLTAGHLLCP